MSDNIDQIYGNCIAMSDMGILLRGESGSGKSDLSLRLIDHGAFLVADDRIDIRRDGTTLYASAPESLRGLMEVRGLGILKFEFRENVRIGAVVDLRSPVEDGRLPAPETTNVFGCDLPSFQIDPRLPSAVIKVTLVSRLVSGSITRTDD